MPNILLLEPDRQLARNIKDHLIAAGYSAQAYSDPQSAIMAADKQRPDLVVMDLLLAGRSGIEFLYELRSYPEWQDIPVIISGRLAPDELESYAAAFRQLGIGRYLHKPALTLAGLLAAAESLLRPSTA